MNDREVKKKRLLVMRDNNRVFDWKNLQTEIDYDNIALKINVLCYKTFRAN